MKISKPVISDDNTKKYYFIANDSQSEHIESCLLNLKNYGYIICVSSQIGCSQKCAFCAAGNKRFVRNLSTDEIYQQVELIIKDNNQLEKNPFQITYMGSGEPFNNFSNVFSSIDAIRKDFKKVQKINISSTFPKSAEKSIHNKDWSAYEGFLHFQYSLHFTKDDLRKKYLCTNLLKIDDALNHLNRISNIINDVYKINYIPFDGLNDDNTNINELFVIMSKSNNAILKVSNMCNIAGTKLLPSKRFEPFVKRIINLIPNTEVFYSDGTDVNAGCGQFYNDSIL